MSNDNVNYSQPYPLISIYIPTHNRIDKLKRAISSVQQQTYKNIEILICDDASVDGTYEFIQELKTVDGRIRYFRNEMVMGACAARNLGIFNAKGEFITGLDDDDEFTEDRINFLLSNWSDKYSFICCNFTDFYKNRPPKLFYAEKDFIGNYKNLLFENVCSNQIFTLTTRLRSIGGFDTRAKRLQDWDTWLRLSYKYGDFKRFGNSKYVMHHDEVGIRVSNSYTLSDAISDLKERNRSLYSTDEATYLLFLVQYFNGKYKLTDALYWSYKKKKISFIAKYIIYNLSNIFHRIK
jgi:glycosyltransferase involved in cell wall biosynthesis